MPFDYKKEYKEFYLPPTKPSIVDVPPMNYVAVRGRGDPNTEGGEYGAAMGLLYGIAFTLKMSWRSGWQIEGYFEYVVPPLEGFWHQEGVDGMDYSRKADFEWISVIRLPDFVKESDFLRARDEAERKKKTDFSKAFFMPLTEGLCVQAMHIGPYDDEPATVAAMDAYAGAEGYCLDFSDARRHHEIYLGDPRKCAPEKLRTVIRHPVRKK